MSAIQDEAIPPLTLGWRLQMAMRHADLTALEMAQEMEVSRDTVARWIHDETVPHRFFLQAWAERCGVNYDWLVGDEAPKAEVSPGRRAVTDNKKYPERRRRPGKARGLPDRPQSVSLPHHGAETHSYRFCRRSPSHDLLTQETLRDPVDGREWRVLDHSPWVATCSLGEA